MCRNEEEFTMKNLSARRILAVALFCSGVLFTLSHARLTAAAAHGPAIEAVPEMIGDGVISTPDDEFGGTPSPDGQYDIYRSQLTNGKYEVAEDLGPLVNRPGVWSLEAWVAPDESYLLIGSFGREGYGNSDLYVSFRLDGAWTAPVNLGPTVNTTAREYSARVSADGHWLYYTSETGMPYEKRIQPLTYQQFEDGMKSVRNGLGNIYRFPLVPILEAARARLRVSKP